VHNRLRAPAATCSNDEELYTKAYERAGRALRTTTLADFEADIERLGKALEGLALTPEVFQRLLRTLGGDALTSRVPLVEEPTWANHEVYVDLCVQALFSQSDDGYHAVIALANSGAAASATQWLERVHAAARRIARHERRFGTTIITASLWGSVLRSTCPRQLRDLARVRGVTMTPKDLYIEAQAAAEEERINQLRASNAVSSVTVLAADAEMPPATDAPNAYKRGQPSPLRDTQQVSYQRPARQPTKPCPACGEEGHWKSECQHKDAICAQCGTRGHITKICRATKTTKGGMVTTTIPTHKGVVSKTEVPVTKAELLDLVQKTVAEFAKQAQEEAARRSEANRAKREAAGLKTKPKTEAFPAEALPAATLDEAVREATVAALATYFRTDAEEASE